MNQLVFRSSSINSIKTCGQSEQIENSYSIFRRGHWTPDEHEKYLAFLQCFEVQVNGEYKSKRSQKIFKQMSKAIITRSSSQCRSHHQKFNPEASTTKNSPMTKDIGESPVFLKKISQSQLSVATQTDSDLYLHLQPQHHAVKSSNVIRKIDFTEQNAIIDDFLISYDQNIDFQNEIYKNSYEEFSAQEFPGQSPIYIKKNYN